MEVPSRLLRVVRSLARRGPIDRDLELELEACLEILVAEKKAAGMTGEDARRQALIELGGIEQVKEQVRAVRPAAWLDDVARDVRHGIRVLAKVPSFSLAAILVLALGIAANAAVFGLIDVLLLQPPPGSERPGRAVGIFSHDPRTPDSYRTFSYAEYEAIREANGVFDTVMAHRSARVIVADRDSSRRVEAGLVTADYFATLGVRLAAGRGFTRDEERLRSRAAVAVLSDPAWRALGRRPEALGGTLLIDSRPFTIVGIAPRGFAGTLVGLGPMLWIPLGAENLLGGEAAGAPPIAQSAPRDLQLVGRLKDHVSLAVADAALQGVASAVADAHPVPGARHVLTVHPLARTEEGTEPKDDAGLLTPLGILAGLAATLLVVASLTVANMQLARHAARRREIAMRLALGAGRRRVVQQLMTEAVLLALAGGALGLVIGVWALKLVLLSLAPLLEQAVAVSPATDWRVLLATLAYSLLAAAIFALGPSSKLAGVRILDELKGAGRIGAGAALGPRGFLIAGQLALALALLTAAGLFVRAAMASGRADPGYRLEGQLVARVDASLVPEVQARQSLHALIDRIGALPGVRSASVASLVAFANESARRPVLGIEVTREGAGHGPGGVLAQDYVVGSGYFRTLGLPLLRGRDFTPVEERGNGSPRVVIVDEPLAEALFPGQDAIGRHVAFASREGRPDEPLEIIGVAPGLRQRLTDRGPVAHVYRPLAAQHLSRVNVHVRLAEGSRADASQLPRELRQLIDGVDPRLALLGVSALEEIRDGSPTSWLVRTAGRTLGALGAIGLAMAVTGLYGVRAFLVARRRRELGIRMALGATPNGAVALVLKEGAAVVLAGLAVGLLLALGAGRVVSSLLVGVRPFDPLVFCVATLFLSLAVLIASYVPARRAARVDPAVTLREE